MKYDYDIVIIGGGATGLGCAVEAISRGYRTLLLEAEDFGKGTSSKSTKLIHGGIRYLANLDFALVKEGLEERYYFLRNAPHLTKKQTYLIPMQNWQEKIKYFIGTKLYDFLAGNLSIGRSRALSKQDTLCEAPDLVSEVITGGAIYLDGQFDDTRVLISLLNTFRSLGGEALNYHKVTKFTEYNNKIRNISGVNQLTGSEFNVSAKVVINATGTFADNILDIADANVKHNTVAAAQGTHLVFDKDVFDSPHAILVPETSDGRVLFILPWHNKIVVGTTDVKVDTPSIEPIAQQEEIEFILKTLNEYSKNKVTHKDIRSVFCGQRPLVKPTNAKNTAKISRKHELSITDNGLVTIVGGKWTIYRRMGQDTIDFVESKFDLPKTYSVSKELKLHGYTNEALDYPLSSYGVFSRQIIEIQHEMNNFAKIHADLPYFQAEVIYHVREELAKTVEDVLLRRTRAMFLNATAAKDSAYLIANLMAKELNKSQEWVSEQVSLINKLAQNYIYK